MVDETCQNDLAPNQMSIHFNWTVNFKVDKCQSTYISLTLKRVGHFGRQTNKTSIYTLMIDWFRISQFWIFELLLSDSSWYWRKSNEQNYENMKLLIKIKLNDRLLFGIFFVFSFSNEKSFLLIRLNFEQRLNLITPEHLEKMSL